MESKKSVKGTLYRILSAILAIVSVFTIIASLQGIKDFVEIYCNLSDCTAGEMLDSFVGTPGRTEEADADAEEEEGTAIPEDLQEKFSGAAEQLYELYDGLGQLSENEDVYFDGVAQYNDGLVQLADGRKQLADGEKQIADNTDAYNEGKELISKIEVILPYVEKYQEFRDGSIANIPGFSTAQEYFMKVVRPLAAKLDLEIPEDENDLPKYVLDMVEDGRAQLKMYEDGLVQLADGRKQLADGEQQLADGDAQLKQFEDGQAQIIKDGYGAMFALPTYTDKNGKVVIESPADHFGYTDGTFDMFKKNSNGNYVYLRNGEKALDLEKAYDVMWYSVDYAHTVEDSATAELIPKVVLCVLGIILGIMGLVAGLKGLIFFRGKILTIVLAVLAIIFNIAGVATHYYNYVFPLANGDHAGGKQMAWFIIFMIAAILSAIAAALNLKFKKKDGDDNETVDKIEDLQDKAEDKLEEVESKAKKWFHKKDKDVKVEDIEP